MSNTKIFEDISKIQQEFYSNQRKNIFMKSGQKNECASMVSQSLDLNHLLENTFFIIKDTNHVYIDYTLFKTYAAPENYEAILSYISNIVHYLVSSTVVTPQTFHLHINLNTFTVSAFERYNKFLQVFFESYLRTNPAIMALFESINVYHTPSAMKMIAAMFTRLYNQQLKASVVYYDKDESGEKLQRLFSA